MTILGTCTFTTPADYLIVLAVVYTILTVAALLVMAAGALYQAFLDRYEP